MFRGGGLLVLLAGLAGAGNASAQSCVFKLSANNLYFDSTAQGGVISVTASSQGCSWSASSEAAFVTVPTNTQSGNGIVSLTLSANSTGADLTGTIIVAGMAVSVTQRFTPTSFADVAPSAYYFDAVNLLKSKNITSGCSPVNYCPAANITRAQMAVFMVRAVIGSDNFTYNPAPYFSDVPVGAFAFQWIQKFYELGITAGCGSGLFCPNDNATRAQMAVFIIGMRYGSSYAFDYPATAYFSDVPVGGFAFNWIQRLREDTITSGCSPTQYCPDNPVIRGDMAIFVMKGGFDELLPAAQPVITSISPPTIAPGTSGTFTVMGVDTGFVDGVTTISAPGVSAGTVSVISPTMLTVQLTAPANARLQPVSIVAITGAPPGNIEAVLPNGLSVAIPIPLLQTVAPNGANAALTLTVSLAGADTNWVDGTTVASFGNGISVGGAAAGQPGPVTVTSPTTATALISIDPAASPGAQTVTVITGTEVENAANGFTVGTAVAVANINLTQTTPLAPGFSGFHDEYIGNGVEYWDPKYIAMVQPLKAGWLRFPGGTTSMAFDWQAGELNQFWMNQLKPNVPTIVNVGISLSQQLTQAKGGAAFADFITFSQLMGANAIVDFNGWTDTRLNSAQKMVQAAQTANLNVKAWEIDNEAYFYPNIFATASSYASASFGPYFTPINTTDPSSTVSMFYQGQFSGVAGAAYGPWDTGMQAYAPQYWQGVSMHIYPITDPNTPTVTEEQTLNGVLAHGTNDYFNSYVNPLIGANTPIFLSEVNSDGLSTLAFESYIYNAIFLAEYVARVATVPNIKAVGITQLYIGYPYNQGMIRATNDNSIQGYLLANLALNPNFSTDTATDPNTQFIFYYSTNALALEILNNAVNSSNATWPTTFSGGPMVPILGYDGLPVPAVFAQGFQGSDGTHYLILTNKSNVSVPVGIEVNGLLGPGSVSASYITAASDTAQNTSPTLAVQIQNAVFSNPLTIPPYSVTRLQW